MDGKVSGFKLAAETAVILLSLFLLGFFVSAKEGFHMDELLSFELANAEYNPWIVPTQPEGRLAKFVRNEIDGDSLWETLGNLGAEVEDVLKNRGDSKLLTYKADVYEEPVWITGEQFRDYITVGKGDAFNYLSVYFNVKDDNHPPLHFMLLHTVSSLFRGQASAWMGCVINLAAVAVVLVLLMKLGAMFAGALGMERYSWQAGLLCALLYGISAGAAATVLLIRMYAMVTMWCVAYLYLVLGKWRDSAFDKHNGVLILVTALGFWTQYFFLFYCILLAAAVIVLLSIRKEGRQLWGFVRSMGIAAAVGLLGFPFAVSDVFSSGRGVEALENLSQGLSGYGERVRTFFGILIERAFSPWFLLLLAALAAAALAAKLWGTARSRGRKAEERGGARKMTECGSGKKQGAAKNAVECGGAQVKGVRGRRAAYVVMLLVPMAGYFLLAARMSPYLVDRYIMPLFPFTALAGALLLFFLIGGLESCIRGARSIVSAAVCFLAAALQLVSLIQYDGSYLYRGYSAQESVARDHAGEACICIYDGVGYYENLKEFTYYDRSLLLKAKELENRRERESIEALEECVLLIKGGVEAEAVLALLEEQYGFTVQEKAFDGDSVYGDAIYILRKGA